MTTAARPTFDTAKGGSNRGEKDLSALSKQYSSRDLPSHTKLKYRETGQGTNDEIRSRDLRKELEDRETSTKSSSSSSSKQATVIRRALEANTKRQKLEQNPDADDPVESDNSDDSDSDDDTAALLAELNKIKRERAVDSAKKEAEKVQEEERIRMENILSGNPLLNYASAPKGSAKVKRRWNDDVVFKNCARSEVEKDGSFINDSLRSEFHKKFMDKYIK
ncbi:unnamed protein product [Chironomus riparius]|uniref:Uncharacterized protein n=1 Tax=Chironomus riparius TaxID=315576 RepID=A0A9N9RQY4_9DIPT|nr:unnamed protein product [Chironomus riparius]